MENPTHLGDGAYATFDRGDVVLTANHHDPQRATGVVYLDQAAVVNLIKWYEAINK